MEIRISRNHLPMILWAHQGPVWPISEDHNDLILKVEPTHPEEDVLAKLNEAGVSFEVVS